MPSPDQLRGVFAELGELLSADPALANQVLKARFTPVVLTPTEEKWTMKRTLKMDPAALVSQGGRKVRSKEVAGACNRGILDPRRRDFARP